MRRILVTCAALAVALAVGRPVGAVIGPLDVNAHPNVGVMIVADADGNWLEFCGGVLISPTAFLTNNHCPGAVAFARSIGGVAQVTFDQVAWPPEQATWHTVVAGYVHPDANLSNGSDLYGIAVFAKPVRGITPARLPTLQQLASLRKGQTLTVVGYGTGLAERRSATASVSAISSGTLQLLNNTNATGLGGACGDGGAPYFLGSSNVVAGVADGETGHGNCSSISWAFRNDTETARSFFDDFVTVP
jgi:trypsin